jgi:hypothetical protein
MSNSLESGCALLCLYTTILKLLYTSEHQIHIVKKLVVESDLLHVITHDLYQSIALYAVYMIIQNSLLRGQELHIAKY